MGVNEAVRSAEFRMAYWERIEEMVSLLDGAAQGKAGAAADEARLGRKTVKRFKSLVERAPPGPLSLEQADKIAKRYALWTVRRKFDWGRYPPDVSPATRRIDEEICSGIYDLDVSLRRQVEHLLLSGRQDLSHAAHLRSLVEARAGQMAAALDVARTVDQSHDEWDTIATEYDAVCNDLDLFLTLAGSPGG